MRVMATAGTTVAELKRLLAPLSEVEVGRQRLVFAGRLLRDRETLGETVGIGEAGAGFFERVVLLLPDPGASAGGRRPA
jgi:hypothetical protein